MKFNKSDYRTNIDKFRVDANITEYHIISKIIFRRIIITKFMIIRQLFHVKIYFRKYKEESIDLRGLIV